MARYAANIDEMRRRNRESASKNSETNVVRVTKWRKDHPDQFKATTKARYARKRDEILAKCKIYHIENPEVARASNRKRRAIKKGATIGEPFKDIEIFDRDGWICSICHKRVNKKLKHPNPLSASIDHIIPLSKGGEHSRKNVALAHLYCNLSKRDGSIQQQQRLF